MDCKIQIADSTKKELAEIVKYISVDLGEKKLQVNQILKQWHSF